MAVIAYTPFVNIDGELVPIGGAGKKNTSLINVTSKSTESISESAETQQEVNQEIKEYIDLIEGRILDLQTRLAGG